MLALPLCPGSVLPHGTRQTSCLDNLQNNDSASVAWGRSPRLPLVYHCPSGPTVRSQAHLLTPSNILGKEKQR